MAPRPPSLDLSGLRFGRLIATERVRTAKGRTGYTCVCDCGVQTVVGHAALANGKRRSCGCGKRDTAIALCKANKTHGHSSSNSGRPTPTFTAWVNMIQRCENPKHNSFDRYGGRGIKVCARWKSFEAFLEDIGEKPPGLEIDREDNNGDYAPGNCRWVTRVENANNREANRALTLKGRTQNIKQWAAELGCSHQVIGYRLRNGWSVEEALTRSVIHGNNGWDRGSR